MKPQWNITRNLPYRSKKSIAERIGKTEKTVQRRIAKLQHAGFAKRVPRYSAAKGQLSNIYDFSGLIAAATPFAMEAVERKEEQRTEAKTRATRKKAKLRIVKDGERGT